MKGEKKRGEGLTATILAAARASGGWLRWRPGRRVGGWGLGNGGGVPPMPP